MRNVSFIIKKAFILIFALALVSLLPLHNNILSNNAVVAQASEVKNDKTQDARLTYTTVRVVVDDTRVLSVRNLDRDAGETAVFKSDDAKIATIKADSDSKATITAAGVGETTITAVIRDAKKRTIKTLKCSITVGPPAQSVKFTESDITIKLSDECAMTLKAILKPGNTEEKPKITVSKDGVVLVSEEANVASGIATITVKAVDIGKVTITITIENELTDTCTIQVVE